MSSHYNPCPEDLLKEYDLLALIHRFAKFYEASVMVLCNEIDLGFAPEFIIRMTTTRDSMLKRYEKQRAKYLAIYGSGYHIPILEKIEQIIYNANHRKDEVLMTDEDVQKIFEDADKSNLSSIILELSPDNPYR